MRALPLVFLLAHVLTLRIHAASLVLSEFMASNHHTLADGNGNFPDWIEIYNSGDLPMDLANWHLTDNPANLSLWTFPGVTLQPRSFLVVFASGAGAPDAQGRLHTNFQLAREGGFLALVEPDGVTVASSFNYPAQLDDVSYGPAIAVSSRKIVGIGAPARMFVTTASNASEFGILWTGGNEPFNDALWSDVVLPIGYDSADTNAPVNAALGKPVIASGPTWPGLPKENLTDGNLTSFTHCAVPEPASWFMVDLGATYALDHLELFNRTDGCCPERLSNFTVSILADDDGQPGAVLWSADIRTDGSNSGVGGKDVVRGDLDHDGIFAGRWIRVQSRPDSGDRYFQIAELRAFVFTSGSGYAPLIRSEVGPAMKGVSGSAFLRIPFEIAPADSIERATLRLHYDDGFIAFVNGKEIARRNARLGPPLPNGTAVDFHSGLLTETFDVPANWFRPGANVLAFQGLNVVASDRDFLLFPELNRISTTTGNPGYFKNPSPGDFNGTNVVGFVALPQMSVPRGFFDAPFEVVVSCSTPGSTLVYTTNSSQPSLTNGILAGAASATDFPVARIQIGSTTVLRAAAFKDGLEPPPIQTQTYLFLDAVLRQPKRPAGVPASWAGFTADYEMDPRVVTNAAYQAEIRPGLCSIPTLSIVLAPDDLFGATRGIYIFPEQVGDAWERRASVELIRPDGTTGFQADCGIRVWGTGWRSHAASLKHAFQLKFKDDYGPSRLDYPLFPNTRMASFDHIVLRAQGSRSWNDFRQPDIEQTQYIHDAWARDTARAMGKIDGDATFVHLYLNGLYWGLYNPVEKTDESFGSDYFGGEKEDFDVITSRFNPEADVGDLQVWNEMMALANAGLATADTYARLEQWLDIDDLCDYMLLNIYATNHDGPPSSGNNIRAIRRRTPEGRFRFFVWDMEYTFWDANENNLGGDADNTPTRIFQKLRANPEFRLRFADHAHRHLFNDGALTPIVARERWRARANEIYTAVLGESARWGDVRRPALPYTRNVEWQREQNRLFTQYFPVRTQILIDQLKAANLYPRVVGPHFSQPGGPVQPGFQLAITALAGTIYYTVDGSDPRLAGGAVSPGALWDALSPRALSVTLADSRRVKARVLSGGTWSALNEAAFQVALPLRITELMYHPASQTAAEFAAAGRGFDKDDYEFLELQNVSPSLTVNLRGVRFSAGIELTLGDISVAPGERVVLVRNLAAFANRYGSGPRVAGVYGNETNPDLDWKLSNSGERIQLLDPLGGIVLDFAYQDFWQPSTDGQGRSLEIADPANDPNDPLNWRASRRIGGTPGAPPLGGVKILNLIVEASALKLTFLAEAGVGYTVQWSDAIDRGQWEPVRTLDPPLDDTMATLDVPRKPEAPSGFLRLEAH